LATENEVSLTCQEVLGGICLIKIDKLRFKQIILNLISNAIKYNRSKGSVVVSFEAQVNDKMRIGVKDTGYGIPDDMKGLIFQPFERFGNETVQGTGIGLLYLKI